MKNPFIYVFVYSLYIFLWWPDCIAGRNRTFSESLKMLFSWSSDFFLLWFLSVFWCFFQVVLDGCRRISGFHIYFLLIFLCRLFLLVLWKDSLYGYDLICENNFSLDHREYFSLLIFTSVGNHILNVVS